MSPAFEMHTAPKGAAGLGRHAKSLAQPFPSVEGRQARAALFQENGAITGAWALGGHAPPAAMGGSRYTERLQARVPPGQV